VRVVVARRNRAEYRRSILRTALDRGAEIAANHARRALARRWPDVDVVIVDKAPVRAVLSEAHDSGPTSSSLAGAGTGRLSECCRDRTVDYTTGSETNQCQ
jgi:hypothetical protein